MATAAIVVIGNEILTGKFADENGPYLVRRLRTLGVDLVRIAVIPDELDAIAEEVRRCSGLADHVFTSGGVGPTHDDLTVEGVARAFDVELEVRDELLALMDSYDLTLDDTARRMAMAPQGSELVPGQHLPFPTLRVRNVWVLPGVPRLFRAKFESVAARFAGVRVFTDRVHTDERETAIAERLADVAARHPEVDIGSYPRWGEASYRVIITCESRDAEAVARAATDVRNTVHVVQVT